MAGTAGLSRNMLGSISMAAILHYSAPVFIPDGLARNEGTAFRGGSRLVEECPDVTKRTSSIMLIVGSHQSKGYRAEERRRNSPRYRGTTESGIERRKNQEQIGDGRIIT
jgi:hypothetical protein